MSNNLKSANLTTADDESQWAILNMHQPTIFKILFLKFHFFKDALKPPELHFSENGLSVLLTCIN